MKKIVLCAVVGFAALVSGLFVFYAGQSLASVIRTPNPETAENREITVTEPEKIQVEDLIYPKPVVVNQETEAAETETEKENYGFYPGGSYYIIGIAPKGFEDCKYLTIETEEIKTDSDGSHIDAFPIPPKGYFSLENEKEIGFTHLSIANKEIAFETEKKNGISYQFVGKFVNGEEIQVDDYTDYAVLVGKLIKLKNGRKIAEREVKLAEEHSC